MSGQLRKPDMPEDAKGQPLFLRSISPCLVATKSAADTSTAVDITLNTDTKFLSITVEDYPVYMRCLAGASATLFDLVLLPGQHDLAIGDNITAISYFGRGGTSNVVTIEKNRI